MCCHYRKRGSISIYNCSTNAASLPEARWGNKSSYILFALGGFSPELRQFAADPAERLFLVTDTDMLSSER